MMHSFIKPDYEGAILCPSENFNMRKGGGDVAMLILHYTGMASEAEALARLRDKQAEVSAHYVVAEDGRIIQMVAEAARAWHAGMSAWETCHDINSCSIGIELVNAAEWADFPDFTQLQIAALIKLCQNILARHKIAPRYVLGHSDIAPQRKIDPGEKFPWRTLAVAGIGHYVEPSPIVAGDSLGIGACGKEVENYQSLLKSYGYNICINGVFDEQTRLVTCAFQRHFRPALVDGCADFSTCETLRRLTQDNKI